MIEARLMDMVEIVRCKDCKHCRITYMNGPSIYETQCKIPIECTAHMLHPEDITGGISVEPDGYCNLGEKAKEGESVVDSLTHSFKIYQANAKNFNTAKELAILKPLMGDDWVNKQMSRLYRNLND